MTYGFVIWLCMAVSPDQCISVKSTPDYGSRSECAAAGRGYIIDHYENSPYVARLLDCYAASEASK